MQGKNMYEAQKWQWQGLLISTESLKYFGTPEKQTLVVALSAIRSPVYNGDDNN